MEISYYKKKPIKNEIVIGKINRVLPLGIEVFLLDYGNMIGMIDLCENNKELKNGKIIYAMVINERTCELSLKNVNHAEQEKVYARFLENKQAHNILISIARDLNLPVEKLYTDFAYEMGEKNDGLYNFMFKLSKDEINYEGKYKEVLFKFVKSKFGNQKIKIRADINLKSTEVGVSFINDCFETLYEKFENIEIYYNKAPTYTIQVIYNINTNGMEKFNSILKYIESYFENRGIYELVVPPHRK